jgi:prepilin-type N-terminal cleavage/methylation domain-containing protein
MCARRRSAFTLIELLVVLAIIAVLIGLLLPAVQKIRDAAARLQCANNLHQLGLAVHNYHQTTGALPPSRIRDEYASWAVLLLPYVEQDNLFKQWDLSRRYYDQTMGTALTTPVKTYFCPARRSPPSVSQPGVDKAGTIDRPGSAGDYACSAGDRASYGGELDGWAASLTPANGAMICAESTVANGRIVSWRSRTSLASITDGTSNTLLIGERHVPLGTLNADIGDGSIYNGDHHRVAGRCGGPGEAAAGGFVFDLAKGPGDKAGGTERYQRIFGSYHAGLCLFVFCDGSVHALANTIAPRTLRLLAVRNDGEPTADY